ncbi:ABC transporter ATP-binding protein [Robbsia andropogonis]|uniref:ABC transporter ATP-binding protein n=1 Tax=Robbsia andropogonis TaxID=28092 RepID=UPI0021B258F3|nr:ABC transporter ATP-binding protein [Robbsia andropogonis]
MSSRAATSSGRWSASGIASDMAAGDSPSVSTARPRGASVAIHIDQLSHAFIPASTRESDSAWVLDDLTLCVPAGTTMALLGPSGCGKSTLLKLLAGLLRPTCGAIRFGDRLVATGATRVGGGMVITRAGDAPVARRDVPRDAWMAPEDRSLGMVFQDYALWPHMTVAGNVSFPLEMRGIARAARRERVNEALAMVGLADLADRRPQALSGGQQQRVALARAIVAAPDVLLFDEPLSNLDRDLRARLCEDIGTMLRQLGTTAVYVTHDPQEAHALADRIATLAHGRIDSINMVRPDSPVETPGDLEHAPPLSLPS